MQYHNLNRAGALLMGALLMSANISAEESGEAKKEEKVGKEVVEYYKKESRVNSLKSKIGEGTERFEALVKSKNRSQDPIAKQKMAEEMAAIAKEVNEWIREYNSLRLEVKYKYPSKGEAIDRRFLPMKERSVEEMEQTTDVDESLTRVRKKVDAKYAPFKPTEEAALIEASSKQRSEKDPPPKLRLER